MSRILISDVKAIDTRKARGGFFACHNTGVDRSYKDTMSDKLDFIKYLISTLAAASTKLLAATPANADTAGRLNQIVRTADDNVSDGHWARIAPLYEPLAPKLELAVMHVNADIIAGQKPAPDFHTYFCLRPKCRTDHHIAVATGCVYRKPYPSVMPRWNRLSWRNDRAVLLRSCRPGLALIGSIRRECVDHIIVLGETHLRRILRSYARYYNATRTHLALDKDAPVSRPVQRTGAVRSRAILSGLHHHYARA